MTVLMPGMVVVISVDIMMRSASTSFAFSMKLSIGTSLPRSYISNPAVSIMILTRFLPISCVSPSITPITAFLESPMLASSGRCGLRTSSPAYIASEQSSRSVTKYSS